MKVWDLITSCQNQWKGQRSFTKNENFMLEITKGNTTYILSTNYCYTESYNKLRDLNVDFWEMKCEEEEYTLKIRTK